MNDFTPTYLYIKQHSITEKLYFGKTVQNPENYLGSGKHWKAHIRKYGKKHIVTLWYCLFLDRESLIEFATSFSELNDISRSEKWLNLRAENGLDGFPSGATHPYYGKTLPKEMVEKMRASKLGKSIHTEESKKKISDSRLGRKHTSESKEKMSLSMSRKRDKLSDEHKNKIRKGNIGKFRSDETKKKISESRKGVQQKQVECPHCKKIGGAPIMARYHFDKCKAKT